MCQITNLKVTKLDASNPHHIYCGRNKRMVLRGQPFLGNPFKITKDRTREQAIEAYRQWLWKEIQHNITLVSFLNDLTDEDTLFCHCHPLPCHAEVIRSAASWIQRTNHLAKITATAPKPTCATQRIPFGKYCLEELDDVPLQYLDWLSGQPDLYGPLRTNLTTYLSRPEISRELDELFKPDELKPYDWEPARKDRWHHQQRNFLKRRFSEPDEWNWKPTKVSLTEAWEYVVDAINFMQTHNGEDYTIDAVGIKDPRPTEEPRYILEWAKLREMKALTNNKAVTQLVNAYKALRTNGEVIIDEETAEASA